jgi:hypothetical protein
MFNIIVLKNPPLTCPERVNLFNFNYYSKKQFITDK